MSTNMFNVVAGNKKPTTGSGRSHLYRFPDIAEDATPWRVLYASSDFEPCF